MHHILLRQPRIGTPDKITTPKDSKRLPTAYEIYPKDDTARRKPKKAPFVDGKTRPKVALIIDDLGYDLRLARQFIELETTLTFAILPHSPYQKEIAVAAHSKGFEVMLHLPMEPKEYPHVQPGPGTLFAAMSSDEFIRRLNDNLDAVPYIKGVNNHMGSKLTSMPHPVHQIFSILKKRRLFFIDSRSTPDTVCQPAARLLKLPFAERDVFIDHVPEAGFIQQQMNIIVIRAQQRGTAIGIMHPHKITLDVIRRELPRLKKRVIFVPASELVHPVYR